MSLTILLAGMLINQQAIFSFAALNTMLILIPYILVSETLTTALSTSFPFIFFSYLIAIISWLYQRTLDQAFDRLSVAQKQIIQARLLEQEVEIAQQLQQRLYPTTSPAAEILAMAFRCQPARQTGGDFYDFVDLGANKLGIIIADVTGKSLAAALVMTMTRSTLRSEAHRYSSPAQVLYQTNQVLWRDASVDLLITAFYGILNTRTLTLHFANAGHPYPTLKRNGRVEELELPGIPLRALEAANYDEQIIQLQPGDQLVLVSDGIVEAMNAQRQLFGFDRLLTTIHQIQAHQPDQLLQEIWQAVERFRGPAEQHDDATIVIIQVKEDEEGRQT